ncbi:MAG: UrcA family protein [Phenylobacterium sp.]|uniref:UrcA family protein n=1 Tax=Phenylobacterium sp. TaxID=1871053 RepID=UPI001A3E7AAD|nr:UrcA family protein [Phenylobacterium sp.]MBL8770587.1 UrcA family protein [Phenylobacterium sp.]
MMYIATRISGVAMLALAALPIAALPASALAATTVKVSDLNLLSPQGQAAFEQRADQAARNYCGAVYSLNQRAACRVAVRAELAEKVAVVRAAQLERASTFAAR